MKSLRNLVFSIILQISLPICAQEKPVELPYVVFNATKGVILKSPTRCKEFYPVRGTQLFEKDTFLLKNNQYVVKIKDKRNGEIFTWAKGKGAITPQQIVDQQRYDVTDKFFSFLVSLAKETGFETESKRTSHGVLHKGSQEDALDSLSLAIASQIRDAISDGKYVESVSINKVYSKDTTFYYSVQNLDTINYAMVLYTVTKDSVFRHDDIRVDELGRVRSDKIEYLRLIPRYTLNLDYFSLSAEEGENERTCYVLLFNPEDFYIKKKNDKFERLLDWSIISTELKLQGEVNRVIFLKK